ncbi:uncharacterized protein [Arachis hypogaea]|uniref:uncharacterized protein n=1 Tax=Arachis hypogaea TaxID=3818 RepID=UPI003B21813B
MDMKYDRTKDPQEHLAAFEARMNLERVGDAVRCRTFPVTLAGPAIRWFNALPQQSITAFVDISCSFLARFTTHIAKAKYLINLLGITQRIGEPTKKFLDKFNDECLDHRRPNGLAPITEVYQQIADKGILSKPRQLKDRTGENKSLYCDYHKGFGHKTQVCFDLNDALEQAIRKGKLAEFFQFIREPKRTWTTENMDNTPMIVVNVVVGRVSPPKSKSATRKDVRILATSLGNPKTQSRGPPRISFGPEDQWLRDLSENPPMVITARIGTGLVKRILVDRGADSNIIFKNVFDALGLREADLKVHQHRVIGLGDNYIRLDGVIALPVCVGSTEGKKSVMAEFIVLRDSTAYTKFLVKKFVTDDKVVGSIRGDVEMTVACDNTSLFLRKKLKEAAGVFLADLKISPTA